MQKVLSMSVCLAIGFCPAPVLASAGVEANTAGKPASASSAAAGHSPEYATGSGAVGSGGWMAATKDFPQWLVVDLGALYTIRSTTQTFGSADTWSYKIEGSNDDFEDDAYWTTLADVTSGAVGTNFTNAVSGNFRYVRLYVTGSKSNVANSVAFTVSGTLTQQSSASVPLPKPADTGAVLVGAQACNLWANRMDWQTIANYPDRASIMGTYDEAYDVSTDWQIKMAVEHGISFMQPCWFRLAENEGFPRVLASYDHFLNSLANSAKYRSLMRFDIDWINTGPEIGGTSGEDDFLKKLVPYWIKTYFSKPNYLKVDGKPVIAIYDYELFISQMGGLEKARNAVKAFREYVLDAGYPGMVLETQQSGSTTPASHWVVGHDPRGVDVKFGNYYTKDYTHTNADAAAAGFDAIFAYHIPTFTDLMLSAHPDEAQVTAEQVQAWSNWQQYSAIPSIVTASMGWNSAPWGGTSDTWKLTPTGWRSLLSSAKTAMAARGTGIGSQIILLDNWNEYGEGHYIAPTRLDGYGYLDAVGAVFSPNWRTKVPALIDMTPDTVKIPHVLSPSAPTH